MNPKRNTLNVRTIGQNIKQINDTKPCALKNNVQICAKARKAGDPGSNPGPGKNIFS